MGLSSGYPAILRPNLPLPSCKLFVMIVVIAPVLLGSCVPAGVRRRAPADAGVPTVAVAAEPIAARGIRRTITVNGEVEPVSSVDVYPSAGGELIAVAVRVGDTVSRNQIIAQVDPSRPGQVFSSSPVLSPIAGTVTRLTARTGAQVSPQTPIARIATTGELQIVTFVPERFISDITVGQIASVRFDAYPDRQYAAVVERSAPVVDPQARTLETTLLLSGPAPGIRPGLFARIELVLEEQPRALTVPQSAILRRDNQTFVFVVHDERAQMRRIETGIESDGRVELVSGVAAGERVVTRGQNLLEDGSPVRIVDEGPGAP